MEEDPITDHPENYPTLPALIRATPPMRWVKGFVTLAVMVTVLGLVILGAHAVVGAKPF